jgi:hypothetical protein
MSADQRRVCQSCGDALVEGAVFCRACGTRYESAATSQTVQRPRGVVHPGKRRRNRWVLALCAAILIVGTGAAAAILLGDEDAASTTVVVEEGTADEPQRQVADDSIEPGRYVQAASFKTLPHAEAERERLAGVGIDLDVVSSDAAQEFYPGFQVLLSGPLQTGGEAKAVLEALHENGAATAFARELTPALSSGGPDAIAGTWSGTLDRQSDDRSNLNGSLPVTLTINPGGEYGSLAFASLDCEAGLTLSTETSAVLGYDQDPPCAGNGLWRLRIVEEGVMLSLLPADSDVFVLGTLTR